MAGLCSDDSFGPPLSCKDAFDFTLLFEQSIFSIASSAVLLIILPFQLRKVWYSARKTLPSHVFTGKASLSLALAALQLALVVLWSKDNNIRTAIPYAAVYLVATVAVTALAVLEHDRSLRPSTLLSVFLLVSVLFDAVQVRSLLLRRGSTPIAGVLSAAMGLKLTLLSVEARNKRRYLKEPYKQFPPETLSGILNRSIFYWLNPTFLQGYRTGLTLDSLCDIDIALASAPMQSRMLGAWSKYSRKGRYALVLSIVSAVRMPLLAVVLPRLSLVAFNYAQPFLIDRAIRLLEEPAGTEATKYGYGLIAATALIYVGIAISTAMYQYKLYRSLTMVRAATVSLIYVKSLHSTAGQHDEAKAVTLMSTDVDRTVNGLELVHETWARLLEIGIGVWLLARQMGAISVAPVLVAVACFAWQTWLARYIGPRQLPWIEAIQSRVGKTSSVLRNMKAVRMVGLTYLLQDMLHAERTRELQLSKSFRWMIVWINMVASMPQFLAPLVTFAAYALRSWVGDGDQLSISKAFTSLAIVSLVTSPMVSLLASIPALRVAEGCLRRIQEFLLASSKDTIDKGFQILPADVNVVTSCSQLEMRTLDVAADMNLDGLLIKLEGVNLRPSKSAELVLNNASFDIPKGTFNMVTGPVGSGKTTLLRAMLEEVTPEQGSISVLAKSLAYCSQTPWLPNGSIRDVLCGQSPLDEAWYDSVIHACDLETDIQQLPLGHASITGSRGSVLSGGQRQRLALARAVYARKELLLLDDVFSALDLETEQKIAQRLFSEDGLLHASNCTTIMVTHSMRHASMADIILAIDPKTRSVRTLTPSEVAPVGETIHLSNTSGENTREGDSMARRQNLSNKPTNVVKGPSQEDLQDLARRTGDLSVYAYYYRSIGLRRTLLALLILAVYTTASNFPRFWIQWYTDDPTPRLPVFIGVYAMLVLVVSLSQGAMIWQVMISIVPKSGVELHKILLRTVMNAPMHFFTANDSGVNLNRFSQDMTLVDAVLPTVAFGTFLAFLQCVAQVVFVALGSRYMAICVPVGILVLYLVQKVYLRTSRQLRFLDLEARSPLFTHFVETIEGLDTIKAFKWQADSIKANLKVLDQSQKPYYLLFCIQRWLTLVLDLIVAAMATTLVALALSLRSTTNSGALGVALTAILSFSQALQILLQSWTQLETSLGAVARTKNLEMAVLPEDAKDRVQEPPYEWPSGGSVKFRDVCASYDGENLALNHVSFRVKPKQKIGIFGRTGSGKSTLISALLRLVDVTTSKAPNLTNSTGDILIDDVPISTVPRQSLRSRILSIPQEALILPGTIRFNASPLHAKSSEGYPPHNTEDGSPDELIVSALRKVGLWVPMEARGGLDADMTTVPLSQGQLQLFSIARTIIKKDIANGSLVGNTRNNTPAISGGQSRPTSTARILLLDEATSHVDTQTDAKVQALIRQEFRDFTIITVAHRMTSIMDSDMVGLMEDGRMVRFGPPAEVIAENL